MEYFKKVSFLICCVVPLFLAGCKPVVTINSPASGATFDADETITFEGTAIDLQHPDLSKDVFVWTSNLDGEIGTGISFTKADLSEGEHIITLTVTDPDRQAGQSSVNITIDNGGGSSTTTTTTASGARFTDNGDGTVKDAKTGLIWLKNANPCDTKDWASAVAYCSSLKNGMQELTDGSIAGQWRLPTKEELQGIGTDPPATWELGYPTVAWTMPEKPFTNVQSNLYWSGTSYATDPNRAWLVYMYAGEVNGYYKDANEYVWPVRDSKPASTTTTTAASGDRFIDNNNGSVTDTETNLIWLKNANPCGTKTWADAGTYCSNLSSGTAGLTDNSTAGDWRLASIEELQGIGTKPPTTWLSGNPPVTWTMPGAPFAGVQNDEYWSGTSDGNTGYAWDVHMLDGYVANFNKNNYHYVWSVRGGNSTTTTTVTGDRFKDNGNGTVTDIKTGLVWLKNANPCPEGKNWTDAGAYCSSLKNGDAGLTDGSVAGQWRLPNVEELEGIGTDPPTTYCLDGTCIEPSDEAPPITWIMPGALFTGMQSGYYWSGTSYTGTTTSAWVVRMIDGNVILDSKSYAGYYVWPVRSGN